MASQSHVHLPPGEGEPERRGAVRLSPGIVVLGVFLWLIQDQWRGPLAGCLFFIGSLFPAMGFFNVCGAIVAESDLQDACVKL